MTREEAVEILKRGFVPNPQSFWNFAQWGCSPLPLCKCYAIPRKGVENG